MLPPMNMAPGGWQPSGPVGAYPAGYNDVSVNGYPSPEPVALTGAGVMLPPALDSGGWEDEPLPPGWTKHWSNTYNSYYFFNPKTGETNWKPSTNAAIAESRSAPRPWHPQRHHSWHLPGPPWLLPGLHGTPTAHS